MNTIDKVFMCLLFGAVLVLQGLTLNTIMEYEKHVTTGHSITQSMVEQLKKDIDSKTMLRF